MKRVINLINIRRALALSNEMGAESLIKVVALKMEGRISEEEADRLAFQLGEATMTVAFCHQFGIREICN